MAFSFTLLDRPEISASGLNKALLSSTFSWVGRSCGLATLLVFFVISYLGVGCAPQKATPKRSGNASQLYDTGDDVLDRGSAIGSSRSASQTRSAPTRKGETWSIALVTLSGPDHRATAQALSADIRERYPELTPLFVDEVSGGSAVCLGRFVSLSEPTFRETMVRVREIKLNDGRVAFPRALPARPQSLQDVQTDPLDIRSLRKQIGSKHPVYTLQVAQWGTFGDDRLDYETCRARVEALARQLRSQGFTAWFNHNYGKELSSVNVGVFGADAYDPRSTLFAPEVELLMSQFPYLNVNGEPLIDARTGAQRKPFLVEVPRS